MGTRIWYLPYIIFSPTGSGKTVLFELGIIRTTSQNRITGKQVKCVYIAPTKALCSERFRDWAAKFDPLGIKCCELTGDTAFFGTNAWGDAKNASIIITTCEKWDSLTRNWHDHHQILRQIQLLMVDEVHILNESRGSTLEVVTSRMKFRGSEVRFMLVSATVPNIGDIAAWIGSGVRESEPAHVYEFGDDYRPCKLTRHVVGLPRRHGQNDFQFAKILDFKLFSIIQQYSVGKPTLVFCSTRKGVFGTAEQLMKEFTENEVNKQTLPWARPPRINHAFVDKRLDELAAFGIGVHHAGLSMEDRRATEDLYLKKVIRVLVATSTLAVGVNLPAHMVVIKGVKTFQNNASVEYSDLDIMQMLGRAGRPQFDKEGIAVIMCESELEQKYKALVQGKTILESSLHINLAEHLNSEIGLGTITDVNTAKFWLRASFLYQRIQRNPGYYALSLDGKKSVRESVDDLVMQSIVQLEKTELVNHDGSNGKLTSTEFGEIMSKLYIRRATMELILSLPEQATLREIVEVISAAEELQEVKLRASEKTVFNKLRRDIDIRYEIKKVEKTSDKVFLLIQSVLGGISLNSPEYKTVDSQLYMDAFTIFKHVARISRAVVETAICKKLGSQVKNGLELFRCLTAKAWEDRAVVLRQIEQIGEKSIKVLAEHGIISLDILRKQDPIKIETLLNRRHPFGRDVLASLAEFPQYSLSVKETEVVSDGGMNPVQVQLLVECGLANEISTSIKKKQTRRATSMTAVLTLTSDMDLIDFRRIPTKGLRKGKSFEVIAELTKPSQTVIVIITPESIAGVAIQQTFKPSNIPANEYPVLDTRPLSCVEQDLVGLEDDPDFWNMNIDSGQSADSPPKKWDKTADTAKKTSKRTSQEAAKDLDYDRMSLEAKPLPNGTYECNHRCKDKSSCRHMCCREGLAQAPPLRPNSQPPREPLKPKAPSSLQKIYPTNSASTDRTMKGLKSIHERTQVSQNIKLSERGQLLPQPKRKRQIDPHFDIQFTDLKNPDLDDASDSNGIECDSDDLPEAVLPVIGKEGIGLPHPEMGVTSSKVTKTNKTINSKPLLSSRMVNFDPVDCRPTKRIKSTNSATVSIHS
ncbi:P-loop containing nucleoside triphosphate hydrolase protein [Phlegmacium glaucopus]|nr:P-loop containing nucleoside triphosphate hydrolase protein [Phlegmacium glaucopus]